MTNTESIPIWSCDVLLKRFVPDFHWSNINVCRPLNVTIKSKVQHRKYLGQQHFHGLIHRSPCPILCVSGCCCHGCLECRCTVMALTFAIYLFVYLLIGWMSSALNTLLEKSRCLQKYRRDWEEAPLWSVNWSGNEHKTNCKVCR